MKVVIPVHHFPPRYQAGAENYTFRLARWLVRQGHIVRVVCVESVDAAPGTGVVSRDEIYEGIPVSRLSIDLVGAPDAFERSVANPAIGDWFGELLERERPDLVHLNSCYLLSVTPIEATRHRGIPLLVTLHDYWFLCPRITLLTGMGAPCSVPDDPAACAWCLATDRRRFRVPELATRGALGRLGRPLLRSSAAARWLGVAPDAHAIAGRRARVWQALGAADLVIAVTEFQRQLFLRRGFPAARMVLNRLGVDTPATSRPPRQPDPAELRLVYIAQIMPHKGAHLLVEAVNRLRSGRRAVRLRVYGDPTVDPAYVRRLRTLAGGNPAIEFMGAVANAQVGDCLADADALIMPSVWPENSSLAVLEALAAGRPAVVARIGALPELVRDGVDGLTFEPDDVGALTAVLQRLLDTPVLSAQLARQTRPPRGIDDEMAELLLLYRRVAGTV